MDTQTRNALSRFVNDARDLLVEEFSAQLQTIYGIQPGEGVVLDPGQLKHVSDENYARAMRLRDRIDHLASAEGNTKKAVKAAIQRVLREQAFTVLNRFVALRMGEARGLVEDAVKDGFQARGFQVYRQVAGTGLGDVYHQYHTFLECLFDEWALDLGPLFDRFSPFGMLFPREPALKELLALLNRDVLEAVWAEDETIGWVYQYYNDEDERKAMRKASSAPRTSRELAVRNQFFTPRYVVEFLVDNTLGRIWYEMTRGRTALADYCRYRVRHRDEVFLVAPEGPDAETAQQWLLGEGSADDVPSPDALAKCVAYPADTDRVLAPLAADGAETLPTHALLEALAIHERTDAGGVDPDEVVRVLRERLYPEDPDAETPLVVPHRPIKDPREIRLLDPACGSMHFGLYAYDLFERIYEEAWDDHGADLPGLHEAYDGDREAYLRDVPRLIIEHNLHGVDIDPRATQIAALALWLRAQRSWHEAGLSATERPRVQRTNIVSAEPMPGESDLLERFVDGIKPPVLGDLVRTIWEQMELAGEAGTLLKIDEEIRSAVQEARKDYERWRTQQEAEGKDLFDGAPQTRFRFGGRGVRKQFWDEAEELVLTQLRSFADQQGGYRSRLFAGDAAQGFAFIDLMQKRFDVVVMNPPFGASAKGAKSYIGKRYPRTKNDLYAAFVERGLQLLVRQGLLGAITSRTGFFLSSFQKWREEILLDEARLTVMADLGYGVMDEAMVEAAAYCLEAR